MADDPLVFVCTHGPDDPERATVPFILAATAAVSGKRTVVLCTIEGSWMGTSRIRDAEDPAMPVPADLRQTVLDNGGEVWICGACATKRNITGDDTDDGCSIVGAAQIVELLASGRAITPA